MAASDTPARRLVKQFARSYYRAVMDVEGRPVGYAPSWARDQKLIGDLLETFSEEKLGELLDRYFSTERKVYSLVFFKTDINRLMQEDIAENKQYHKQKMVNPDADRFA